MTAPQPSLPGYPLLCPGPSPVHRSTMAPMMAPCRVRLRRRPVTLCPTRRPRCPSAHQRSSSTTPLTCSLLLWADTTGTSAAPPAPPTPHPAHRRLVSPGGAARSVPARTACALCPCPSWHPPSHPATTPARNSPNSHQRLTKGSFCSHRYKASHWWRTPTAASEPVPLWLCFCFFITNTER